ncbi:MAG: POTRA domain-containing protein [Terriglobales bacterium]
MGRSGKQGRLWAVWLGLAVASVAQQQTAAPPQPPKQRPPAAAPAAAIPSLPAPGTGAQTVANLPSYEGQTVVTVELAGWPGFNSAPLIAKLPQKSGQPFSRALVDQSLGIVKSTLVPKGRLKLVQLQIRPELAGIRVLFVLEPADYVGAYQFPGALNFSYTRLLEAAQYSAQQPYSAQDVAAAVSSLQAFFKQEGYFLARVTPHLQVASRQGLVNINFATSLGPHARYGSITLAGASARQRALLLQALRSWMARLRSSALIPGHRYSLSQLQNAVQYAQSTLNGQGYLGAQVTLGGARYAPATNRADITLNVQPGPLVQLQVNGAHLWPWTRHSLLPIYAESRVDSELIQEGQDNLTNYFAAHGYFQTSVNTRIAARATPGGPLQVATTQQSAATSAIPQPLPPSPATPPTVESITYSVDKGPRRDVEGITFSGNQFFSREDLLPLVTVKSEHFLSHGSFSQQLLRESVSNIAALYQASGYSQVRVTPQIANPGGNLTVRFVIAEGPQDFVSTLTFAGNTVDPGLLAPQGLMLGLGTPFAQKLVSQDRNQILAYYYSHGYLNATFRATAEKAPHQPHEIAVVYHIAEGPQVRTATVVTVGRRLSRQKLIDRLTSNLKPGSFLTQNDLLTAESQLYQPGIFDWAEVSPRRPITTQAQEDVVVRVHEARRNTLIYGFGFDLTNRGGSIPSGTVALPGLPIVGLPSNFKTSEATFYGPSGNIEYTRSNLFGKAETLSLGAFAGRLDQRGSLSYSDPSVFWSKYSGNFLLSAEHDSENPIFTSRAGEAGYQLERPLNPDRTTNLFLRYDFSETQLANLLIPDLVAARDLHTRLSTLSATFLRDTRDNPLDAHKGMLESYELDYSSPALGSSANFAKLLTQTAYYKRIPDGIIWANSLRLGADHAFGDSFVPLSQSFFSGGGSTLRGFPLDGAGPQKTIPACGNPTDPSTCTLIRVPVGGNELLIVNSELRIPTPQLFPNLGVALFYDGGNVFTHAGLGVLGTGYTNTIGAGLRYETAVGPIRIDLGHLLSPISGISSTQLFITLGQAF